MQLIYLIKQIHKYIQWKTTGEKKDKHLKLLQRSIKLEGNKQNAKTVKGIKRQKNQGAKDSGTTMRFKNKIN